MTDMEIVDRIEPVLLEDTPANITDIVAELSGKAATLAQRSIRGLRSISPIWCAS